MPDTRASPPPKPLRPALFHQVGGFAHWAGGRGRHETLRGKTCCNPWGLFGEGGIPPPHRGLSTPRGAPQDLCLSPVRYTVPPGLLAAPGADKPLGFVRGAQCDAAHVGRGRRDAPCASTSGSGSTRDSLLRYDSWVGCFSLLTGAPQ
jgi:hypothetical protein